MGTTGVRIVEDPYIALMVPALCGGLVDDGLDRKGHDADENRQAGFALHQGFSGYRIIDAVRGIMCFSDDRVEGGAEQGRVHFVGDLLQPALEDGQRYGIDTHSGTSFVITAAGGQHLRCPDHAVDPG